MTCKTVGPPPPKQPNLSSLGPSTPGNPEGKMDVKSRTRRPQGGATGHRCRRPGDAGPAWQSGSISDPSFPRSSHAFGGATGRDRAAPAAESPRGHFPAQQGLPADGQVRPGQGGQAEPVPGRWDLPQRRHGAISPNIRACSQKLQEALKRTSRSSARLKTRGLY